MEAKSHNSSKQAEQSKKNYLKYDNRIKKCNKNGTPKEVKFTNYYIDTRIKSDETLIQYLPDDIKNNVEYIHDITKYGTKFFIKKFNNRCNINNLKYKKYRFTKHSIFSHVYNNKAIWLWTFYKHYKYKTALKQTLDQLVFLHYYQEIDTVYPMKHINFNKAINSDKHFFLQENHISIDINFVKVNIFKYNMKPKSFKYFTDYNCFVNTEFNLVILFKKFFINIIPNSVLPIQYMLFFIAMGLGMEQGNDNRFDSTIPLCFYINGSFYQDISLRQLCNLNPYRLEVVDVS